MSGVNHDLYKAEERRMAMTEARRGLRIHEAVTVLVCLGLAVVNVFFASEFPWAIFPALGMSLGVWFHWYFGVQHGDEFIRRHQEDIEREVGRHAA